MGLLMGNRPDCVHCRFMLRQAGGEYRCRQHNIILHSPVSLFCKQISPIETPDDAERRLFEENIDPTRMSATTLYTWIETHLREGKSSITQFDSEELGTITAYGSWAAGTFWQMIRAVRQAKRDFYRQQGYEIDE
jgi:hypothetical protein